ncbi:MAG TPA: hypothetical protein VG346_01320 [Acidimicrobiales bacterium]|nr:hypothetical protein [Acidimicrobiales bacterium]
MSTTATTRRPQPDLTSDGRGSWLPTWPLISTKFLELRKRRGLMIAVVLLSLVLPVLVLGLRLLFHAIDPQSYGPAGSPSVFEALCDPLAQFGFIIAAALGATAGATDLGEGMFRHLVITGRSRVALYLARIPSGLAIILPLIAIGFTFMCLVTAFEGTPQPTSVQVQGVTVPLNLSEGQLHTFLLDHASEFGPFGGGPIKVGPGGVSQVVPAPATNPQQFVRSNFSNLYQDYLDAKATDLNPAPNEMVKIGLWIELEVALGFIVGLGLGSLTGQRTVSVIVLIALQIIVTPILAGTVIPHFLDGQRLVVGVAMDQLRPAALISTSSHHGPGRVILGGRGSLGIPAMPTWAMITVIVGWLLGWTGIGAWKMATRDT